MLILKFFLLKKEKKEDNFLFKTIRTEDSVVVIVAYKNKLYHIHDIRLQTSTKMEVIPLIVLGKPLADFFFCSPMISNRKLDIGGGKLNF